MEMPNIIQFRILMPKEIKNVDGDPIVNDIYMQVQLYNYKEIWVTLNIKREERIYIDSQQMKLIIKAINKFIERLNK